MVNNFINMKTLLALLLLIPSLSWGETKTALPELSDEQKDYFFRDLSYDETRDEFCEDFGKYMQFLMQHYNDRKKTQKDINKKIEEGNSIDENFGNTKEYKKLSKQFKENGEYIHGTLHSVLESKSNIWKNLCD